MKHTPTRERVGADYPEQRQTGLEVYMAVRILKNRGNDLGAQIQSEISHWDSGDLRDFLSLVAARNVNQTTCEDASEALAYLNWRWNQRMNPEQHQCRGGDRCKAPRFDGKS